MKLDKVTIECPTHGKTPVVAIRKGIMCKKCHEENATPKKV